jgi:hypothetical protein
MLIGLVEALSMNRQGRERLRRALELFGRDEYQDSTESRPTEGN